MDAGVSCIRAAAGHALYELQPHTSMLTAEHHVCSLLVAVQVAEHADLARLSQHRVPQVQDMHPTETQGSK